MQLQYLDGDTFLEALRDTTEQLRLNRQKLNQINVFPVPDGDTGNNLLHTFESALEEAQQAFGDRLGTVVEAASRGAQNGSCGSSGAIFAQFLKGWALVLSHLDRAGVENVVKALKEGAIKAYAAVVRPVEGTILTVARKAAEGAQAVSVRGDMAETLLAVYHQGLKALNQTPRMLEALGNRGVVDAGGWGLLLFFSSLLKAMHVQVDRGEFKFDAIVSAVGQTEEFGFTDAFDMEFSFCYTAAAIEKRIRDLLHKCGSELITRINPGHCHVHIHTDRPLVVMERAATLGPPQDIIIRDMRVQFSSMKEQANGLRDYAVIALGYSPGFLALYALAGAEVAVSASATQRLSRLAEEFRGRDTLILEGGAGGSSGLNGYAPLSLGEEVRVLAALLSLQGTEMPPAEAVYRAAGYPRTANIAAVGSACKVCLDGATFECRNLKEALHRAVAGLAPERGEIVSLYYGRGIRRALMEKSSAWLLRKIPGLEMELFYGGQEHCLVVAVE